jgi:hypothetical protein
MERAAQAGKVEVGTDGTSNTLNESKEVKMGYLFVLRHDYEVREGDIYKDYETFIGIYSTEYNCKRAIDEIKNMKEFKGKKKHFNYSKIKLDRDRLGWSEGFADLSLEGIK